ncbi:MULTISPECIES: hypothetical protein [Clostridium]|uniref:hypothetical protein n=1 Tax=Clostridium TaxID=1485 RepID=UPI0008255100|nr:MULTISPECIES: hypothetical protein [Clostridium]PJI07046.1 hypothetical protein CUB90_03835 [Clostridium sp. CT7]
MIWNEDRKQKIRNQLIKKVMPFTVKIDILRQQDNVFNEKQDYIKVCTVNGYYHTGTSYISGFINDSSSLKRSCEDRLLLIVNDDVKKIKEHDRFILDEVMYEIIDKGNISDIVWDTYLNRME